MYILQSKPWTNGAHVVEPSWLQPAEAQPVIPTRYTPIKSIACNTGSTVLLAQDTFSGLRVIVKTYQRTASSWRRLEKSLEAYRLAGGHQHIVQLVDVHETSSCLVIAQEYLPDGDLADRVEATVMKRGGALSAEKAILWGRHILSALQHMHTRGVVHRDVKPENCALLQNQAKLIDFGLAALAADVATQGRVGTVCYNAPEVFGHYSRQRVDWCAADIWSFGVTLLVLLTLRLPWERPCPTDHNFRRAFQIPDGADEPPAELDTAERRAEQWRALYPDLPRPAAWLLANLLCLRARGRWTAAEAMAYADEHWPAAE